MVAVLIGAGLAVYLLQPASPPPSVVIVTIDTLRADALRSADMPELLALAARGQRFSARTPVPLTLPAHATLFSGLDPAGHGIRDNTSPALAAADARAFTLLAEEFSDAGYATAAFVASSVLDPRYRLDAGFDEYRHPAAPQAGAPTFHALMAEEQIARFETWIAARPKDRPFLAWIHIWEPHAPYEPYDGDERRAGTAAADAAPLRYRGETRRADAALERMLHAIDAETTVIVVTSDHGESLGEHGEATHGYLCHGSTMQIPLVLAGPGVPTGTETAPASLTDVAPTLRRLCGLDPRDGDGHDLLALPEARVLVGESLYAYRLYRWAQQSVAYDGRYALVDGGPTLQLFDLESDPGEVAPLDEPARHSRFPALARALVRYRARRGAGREGTPLSAAPLYYGASRIAGTDFLKPGENRLLLDVAANLKAVALLNQGEDAVGARRPAQVEALVPRLMALAERDARNPAPCLLIGRARLLVLKRPAEAATDLEEAIRRGYDSRDVYRLLERAYVEAGDEVGVRRVRAHLGAR